MPAVINTIKNVEEQVFTEWPPHWIKGPLSSIGASSSSIHPAASCSLTLSLTGNHWESGFCTLLLHIAVVSFDESHDKRGPTVFGQRL